MHIGVLGLNALKIHELHCVWCVHFFKLLIVPSIFMKDKLKNQIFAIMNAIVEIENRIQVRNCSHPLSVSVCNGVFKSQSSLILCFTWIPIHSMHLTE